MTARQTGANKTISKSKTTASRAKGRYASARPPCFRARQPQQAGNLEPVYLTKEFQQPASPDGSIDGHAKTFDVRDGKGQLVCMENSLYRSLVRANHLRYKTADKQHEKRKIAAAIHDKIVVLGGRFVDRDGNIKTEAESIDKIKKSLKDMKAKESEWAAAEDSTSTKHIIASGLTTEDSTTIKHIIASNRNAIAYRDGRCWNVDDELEAGMGSNKKPPRDTNQPAGEGIPAENSTATTWMSASTSSTAIAFNHKPEKKPRFVHLITNPLKDTNPEANEVITADDSVAATLLSTSFPAPPYAIHQEGSDDADKSLFTQPSMGTNPAAPILSSSPCPSPQWLTDHTTPDLSFAAWAERPLRLSEPQWLTDDTAPDLSFKAGAARPPQLLECCYSSVSSLNDNGSLEWVLETLNDLGDEGILRNVTMDFDFSSEK
jgi:hypothetical protein